MIMNKDHNCAICGSAYKIRSYRSNTPRTLLVRAGKYSKEAEREVQNVKFRTCERCTNRFSGHIFTPDEITNFHTLSPQEKVELIRLYNKYEDDIKEHLEYKRKLLERFKHRCVCCGRPLTLDTMDIYVEAEPEGIDWEKAIITCAEKRCDVVAHNKWIKRWHPDACEITDANELADIFAHMFPKTEFTEDGRLKLYHLDSKTFEPHACHGSEWRKGYYCAVSKDFLEADHRGRDYRYLTVFALDLKRIAEDCGPLLVNDNRYLMNNSIKELKCRTGVIFDRGKSMFMKIAGGQVVFKTEESYKYLETLETLMWVGPIGSPKPAPINMNSPLMRILYDGCDLC